MLGAVRLARIAQTLSPNVDLSHAERPADAGVVARPPAFSELVAELRALGCFRPAPFGPLVDAALTFVSAVALFVLASQAPLWAAVPLFALASLLHARIGWAMHDAAHGNLFERKWTDEILTWVFCFLLGEFPSGWRHGHDAHHRATNIRSVDRDKRERWEPGRRYRSRVWAAIDVLVLVRRYGLTLPRLLAFLGIRDGVYAARTRPDRFPAELVAAVAGTIGILAFFVYLYGGWGIALYVPYSWIAGVYLNLIFAGNHYDRPAWDEPPALDFAARQILTTTNYSGGALVRALCGGLESHIEHHLFPKMPRSHLRRASPAVRRYCEARGMTYVERSFGDAVRSVIDYHVDPAARA